MISNIQKIIILFCTFMVILIYFLINPLSQEQKQLNYEIQKPYFVIDDILENRNWDDYDYFRGSFLFGYKEYEEFCNRYNLNIAYENENLNYIVLTSLTTGWYTNKSIEKYKTIDDTIYISLVEEKYGVTTGDIDGYVFIIPCDSNIKKIDVDVKSMTKK